MKKLIILTIIITIIISGCKHQIPNIKIYEWMMSKDYDSILVNQNLGSPSSTYTQDMCNYLQWDNYELIDGFKGNLILNTRFNQWWWKTQESYDSIIQILDNAYEQTDPLNSEINNVFMTNYTCLLYPNNQEDIGVYKFSVTVRYNAGIITVGWGPNTAYFKFYNK